MINTVGTGENANVFKAGQRIYWQVRWDFDPTKEPYVNAPFGRGPLTNSAYQLDKMTAKDVNPNDANQTAKLTMKKVTKDMNDTANYDQAKGMGTNIGLNWRLASPPTVFVARLEAPFAKSLKMGL